MKNQIIIIALFGLLFLFSCHKEKAIDEVVLCIDYIQPGVCFPAHPGSWWTYIKQNEGTITYEIDSVVSYVNGQCLPYFKNLDCYVSGSNFKHGAYHGLGQSSFSNSAIYSSEINVDQYCFISFAKMFVYEFFLIPPYRRRLIKEDTTITTLHGEVYTNIIVIKETFVLDSTHLYLDYFASNVGLIKRDSINYQDTNDLTEILTLDKYFINN